MHRAQWDVQDFHKALDVPVGTHPELPSLERCDLRATLIMEEAAETAIAITGRPVEWRLIPRRLSALTPDLVETIDGMCDLLVVTYGTAVECGVDLEPYWNAVHKSNMAKKGGATREDGKKLKPEGWQPPDIAGLLEKERAQALYRA